MNYEEAAYLLATMAFIYALKKMSQVSTARRGNLVGAVGMLLAIVFTLADQHVLSYGMIAVGLMAGTVAGWWMAVKVQMTQMPQMVALLNGFGGLASTLVAVSEYHRSGAGMESGTSISVGLSILVGGVTFTGSMIAFAKLQGWMPGRPLTWPMQKLTNGAMVALSLAGCGLLTHWTTPGAVVDVGAGVSTYAIVGLSLVLGVTSVVPIGGADMPVVISLLNSYSGIAASCTGFVLGNHMLIVAGALVGASGIILTQIMCKGMNRSLANVLFAAVGTDGGGPATQVQGTVRSGTSDEAAIILANARQVVFVPGYGMAVAQAQHAVRELADALQKNGTTVKYAIHPVAGRMPGHMNILLAEAKVPYDQLFDMDSINDDFANTDVAIVIGANDVVNPAARTERNSPIYGMPILNVDQARTVFVVKRGMGAGFAGVENPLFIHPRTMMLFGDAKKMMTELLHKLKENV